MDWIVYSFLFTFCYAAFSGLNRYFKVDGMLLAFWRLVVSLVVLFPFVFFVSWPENKWFYVIAVFNGIIMTTTTFVRFNLAAQHNGRVASMFMPVQVFGGFFIWLMIDRTLLATYLANPLQTLGILLCMGVVAISLFMLRQNDIGWRMFLIAIPIGVAHALLDVTAKIAMSVGDILNVATVFIFISFSVGLVYSGIYIYLIRKDKVFYPPKMFQACFWVGLIGLLGIFLSLAALQTAPNPAYFAAITMLSPVWLLFFHKIFGVEDKASPIAGMVMLAAAIALILIAR